VARRAGRTFEGVRDAIACGAAGRAVSEVGRAADEEADLAAALARTTSVRTVLVGVGGQLPLVALLLAAPWLLREGRLSAGELVGAATYLVGGLEPALRQIVGVVSSFGPALIVCLDRLGEVFTAAGPVPAAAGDPRTGAAPAGKAAAHAAAGPAAAGGCDLAVRGLTFRYGTGAAPVVDGLDLDLADGGHLAVVGVSGVGKSTLAGLLAGLLRPDHGTVRLGGVDVGALPPSWLRTRVALIPQEAYVFAGTLRENLVYLAPEADDRAVSRAVREVGLEPLVDRLGGLGARVGAGGADLSQGERQLVALARVHLSPARLVILDEATSNLDPAAEARAERAFAGRPGSLVVVAHRISSAYRADRILLLDDDGARQGTHADLLACSRRYAELVGWWGGGSAPERTGVADRAGG
jgi:ATP-binding cassette subfamily C protein